MACGYTEDASAALTIRSLRSTHKQDDPQQNDKDGGGERHELESIWDRDRGGHEHDESDHVVAWPIGWTASRGSSHALLCRSSGSRSALLQGGAVVPSLATR